MPVRMPVQAGRGGRIPTTAVLSRDFPDLKRVIANCGIMVPNQDQFKVALPPPPVQASAAPGGAAGGTSKSLAPLGIGGDGRAAWASLSSKSSLQGHPNANVPLVTIVDAKEEVGQAMRASMHASRTSDMHNGGGHAASQLHVRMHACSTDCSPPICC